MKKNQQNSEKDSERKNEKINLSGHTDSAATNSQDTGSIPGDPGTGTGGTDYVGKGTGRAVDESVVGTVSGGGTTTDMIGDAQGATTGGVTLGENNINSTDKGNRSAVTGSRNTAESVMRENSGVPKKESDPDYHMVDPNKRISTDDSSPTDANKSAIQSAERGTGTGAAMNNINEEDVDTGTGSARRGNRAGMSDEDTGKIVGGTATGTGIDDSGLGPEK